MLVIAFFFICFVMIGLAAFLMFVLVAFFKGFIEGGIAYFKARRNLKDMPDFEP